MHVQIVHFNLKGLPDAGFRSMANEAAPACANAPGRLSEIWLVEVAGDTLSGGAR